MAAQIEKGDDGGILLAVESLASVHDRNSAHQSDPPPDASGDSQPDGDGLNYPASA